MRDANDPAIQPLTTVSAGYATGAIDFTVGNITRPVHAWIRYEGAQNGSGLTTAVWTAETSFDGTAYYGPNAWSDELVLSTSPLSGQTCLSFYANTRYARIRLALTGSTSGVTLAHEIFLDAVGVPQ